MAMVRNRVNYTYSRLKDFTRDYIDMDNYKSQFQSLIDEKQSIILNLKA